MRCTFYVFFQYGKDGPRYTRRGQTREVPAADRGATALGATRRGMAQGIWRRQLGNFQFEIKLTENILQAYRFAAKLHSMCGRTENYQNSIQTKEASSSLL